MPVNAPVQILFSEPIQPTSIGQITVTTGGNPVAFTPTFSDANQLLTLTPTLPLLAPTPRTPSQSRESKTRPAMDDGHGHEHLHHRANVQPAPPSVTLRIRRTNASGVGTNVAPRVVFSERLNPLSVVSSSNEPYNRGSVELYNFATGQFVPITVSMSADRMTAIVTPSSALLGTRTDLLETARNYYDVAGNSGYGYQPTS